MRCARDSSRNAEWSNGSRRSVNENWSANVNGNVSWKENGNVSGRRPKRPSRPPEHRRNRGEREVQEKIADLRDRVVHLTTTIRVIAGVAALVQALTGAVEILTALREAVADRTIDLRKITIRRVLCPRRLARTWKSTGKKKSAGLIRTEINVPKRI